MYNAGSQRQNNSDNNDWLHFSWGARVQKISFKFLGLAISAVGLWLGLLPVSLFAQYYDSPGLGEKPVAAHPQDYKPLGIRAGVFMLHPGITLAGEYTDNAFFASDNEQSDTIYHIRPYVTAQSAWSRHSLQLRLAADIARYNDFGERDYEDYFFGVTGRVDVKSRSFFNYGLDYMDLHEGLNNRSSEQGVQPTRYNLGGGNIGYDHTFNRLSLSAKFTLNRLDFDDVLAADGAVIDNQDRDRDESSYSLRAGYQFQTDKQAFISYTGYTVDYDQPFDRNGLAREGDGYTLSGGLAFTMTGKLTGDVFVSYHERQFDDAGLPDVNGWAGGAGLQWNPTDLTSVYGQIASDVEETTDRNSSGFLQTVYSLRVDHALKRFVQLNGFVAYRVHNFQPIDGTAANTRSTDNVLRAGVGLNWFINRFMYLNTSYAYEDFNSSLPDDDYSTNTFWLVLGLER